MLSAIHIDRAAFSTLVLHNWLEIALFAYTIGASIEGVNTARQLSHSLPELVKSAGDDSKESDAPPKRNWSVLAIIAVVSTVGAFSWPCRLIHRSMKESQARQDD